MYDILGRDGNAIAGVFIDKEDIHEFSKSLRSTILLHAKCFYCDSPINDDFSGCTCACSEEEFGKHKDGGTVQSGYYAMDPDVCREAFRKDRRAQYSRENAEKRKERLKLAEGSYTKKDILWLENQQNGECYYCGTDIKNGYDIEHLIPLCYGGENNLRNLVLSCAQCNNKKHTKSEQTHWNNIKLQMDTETFQRKRNDATALKRLKRKAYPDQFVVGDRKGVYLGDTNPRRRTPRLGARR